MVQPVRAGRLVQELLFQRHLGRVSQWDSTGHVGELCAWSCGFHGRSKNLQGRLPSRQATSFHVTVTLRLGRPSIYEEGAPVFRDGETR